MLSANYNMIRIHQRPTIEIYIEGYGMCEAMIDTGSVFPIWFGNEEDLINAGAIFKKGDLPITGISGSTKGKLYQLPYLELGEFVYPYFPIIACEIDNPSCDMLLSATMFIDMEIKFDFTEYKFTAETFSNQICRKIMVSDSEGIIKVYYAGSCTIEEYIKKSPFEAVKEFKKRYKVET